MVMTHRLAILAVLIVGMILSVRSPALAGVPIVAFQYETPAGREAAEKCAGYWADEGPRMSAELLGDRPSQASGDTVTCLILTTAAFQEYFGQTLPDWGVGVALPHGRLIALDYTRMSAVGRGLREVFLHEMVHALLFKGSNGGWLPAWFHEGAAMRYSGEWRFSDTVSLVLDGRVPHLGRLQGRFPGSHANADRAYRTSLLAVNRLQDRHGPAVIADLVTATGRNGNFAQAFLAITGEDLTTFYQDFAGAMQLKFGWLVMMVSWPSLFVLLSLVLSVGAMRKIILGRRRLAAMEEEEPSRQGSLEPPPEI